ncbi:hypothetical protein JB92DRAFT_3122895 [Gautieria morchelliformis]|nr:hypothetical protein JB92DRAFT_3122895 [Gautieria morchelliformis]
MHDTGGSRFLGYPLDTGTAAKFTQVRDVRMFPDPHLIWTRTRIGMFTGIPKAPVFSQNRARFDTFTGKIVYKLISRL